MILLSLMKIPWIRTWFTNKIRLLISNIQECWVYMDLLTVFSVIPVTVKTDSTCPNTDWTIIRQSHIPAPIACSLRKIYIYILYLPFFTTATAHAIEQRCTWDLRFDRYGGKTNCTANGSAHSIRVHIVGFYHYLEKYHTERGWNKWEDVSKLMRSHVVDVRASEIACLAVKYCASDALQSVIVRAVCCFFFVL